MTDLLASYWPLSKLIGIVSQLSKLGDLSSYKLMKKFDLKLRFGQMTTSEMQTMSAMIEKFSVKKSLNEFVLKTTIE